MKGSGSDGKLTITVWDIVQYYYCPLKVYLLKTLGVPRTVKEKMLDGKDEHTKELRRFKERRQVFGFNPEEVKEVYRKLLLVDEDLGLAGRPDLVLELKTGELIPVEIKVSDHLNTSLERRRQITAYILLLEKGFSKSLRRGILYYPRKRRWILVDITHEDKRALVKELENIRRIIMEEEEPPVIAGKRCSYCELKRYCNVS